MPMYEYECACGNTDEMFFHISEAQDTIECKKCGKQMKRIISTTSFALKGSGWYKDGYSNVPAKGSKG